MTSASGEFPPVVTVRFSPPNSSTLETVGVVAKLSLLEKILPERSNSTPPLTAGVTTPPSLLNVMLLRVLFPLRVKTPPPLMVTLLVGAMEPFTLLCVRLAFCRTTSPLSRTAPAGV